MSAIWFICMVQEHSTGTWNASDTLFKASANITLLHAEILDVQSLAAVHILLDLLILTFLSD